MNCAQLAVASVLAADGELSPEQMRLMEMHLATCPACRTQWAIFDRVERRLLECREVLDSLSPSGARPRVMGTITAPKQENRVPLPWHETGWQWATAAMAGLSLAVVAVWLTMAPWPADPGHSAKADFHSRSFSSAELSAGNTQVIRVELPLAPVGDPFLDGSQSESAVLADVTIGSDGQPRAIRLAN
jgi:anti-sigma factor RsiW